MRGLSFEYVDFLPSLWITSFEYVDSLSSLCGSLVMIVDFMFSVWVIWLEGIGHHL